MSNIIAILANVSVADLDAAIPFYQQITGADAVKRFTYKHLQIARVGAFLLIEGSLADAIPQEATVLVQSIDAVLAVVEASGAQVLEGPDVIPNGTRAVIRHPDGVVFEYLQPKQQ